MLHGVHSRSPTTVSCVTNASQTSSVRATSDATAQTALGSRADTPLAVSDTSRPTATTTPWLLGVH